MCEECTSCEWMSPRIRKQASTSRYGMFFFMVVKTVKSLVVVWNISVGSLNGGVPYGWLCIRNTRVISNSVPIGCHMPTYIPELLQKKKGFLEKTLLVIQLIFILIFRSIYKPLMVKILILINIKSNHFL